MTVPITRIQENRAPLLPERLHQLRDNVDNETHYVALRAFAYFKWAADADEAKREEWLGMIKTMVEAAPDRRQAIYQTMCTRLNNGGFFQIRPLDRPIPLIGKIREALLSIGAFFLDVKFFQFRHLSDEIELVRRKLKLYHVVWARLAPFNYRPSFADFMERAFNQTDALFQARQITLRDRFYLRIATVVSAIFIILNVIFKPYFYIQLIGGIACGVASLLATAKYSKSFFYTRKAQSRFSHDLR